MSDLAQLLPRALKELSAALKATAFYPAQHPSVVAALERVAGALKEAMAVRETIRIGVGETAFLCDGEPLAEDDPILGRFAAYLGRRGIGAVILRPPIGHEVLRGFLEVLALDPGMVRSRGGPSRCLEEKRLGGVALEEFDLARALLATHAVVAGTPGAGGPQTDGLSMNDLVARFLTRPDEASSADVARTLRGAARDPGAARQFVRSVRESAVPRGMSGPGFLTSAMGWMAAQVAAVEPEAVSALAANLGAALQDLDPETRMEVLQASIPVAGTSLDLAREIRSQIPADRLGEMIVSLVQSQQRVNPRLTSVVRKVLIDTGGGEASRGAILEAIQKARKPGSDPLADVWTSIESLLEETQDDWISRDYRSLLELIGSDAPTLDEALRQEILSIPGFGEALTEEGTRRLSWLVFTDLLDLESAPENLCRILAQIGERAAAIGPDWFGAAGEAAAGVRAVAAATPPPPPPVREAAARALQAIGRQVLAAYRTTFHSLTAAHHEALPAVLAALGPQAVDPLVAGLREEEDWEIRRTFIPLLAARGREAVPALLARLSDPAWYLVRNVLLTLGEIGDPSTVSAIAATLAHPEPRVRRDAVTALGKIGGPKAFALVRDCLKDPEIAEVATRCLAAIDHARTVATFLELTEKVSLLGLRNERVRGAIKTLGTLGAHESIPRLRTILTRNLWFPLSAGDPVRIAAALALEKIGTAEALRAVEKGARSWRYPVRSVCAAIVEGRQGGAGRLATN